MASDSGSAAFREASSSQQRELMRRVYALYSGMAATIPLDAKVGLGGKLFFGGDIQAARELLFAANIAGAASLAASADAAALRQAMRDGVVDFVVTSLEEALRILKNEIRKRLPVAVGVSVSAQELIEQMLERGVLADLVPAYDSLAGVAIHLSQADLFLGQGGRPMTTPGAADDRFVTWFVDREWMRWMPRLDSWAKSVVPATDISRQRWLQLAPRYLGRLAQREHGVHLDLNEVEAFRLRAEELMLDEGFQGHFRITG